MLCQSSSISVPWSLRPRNRAAAATCGHGCCKLLAILRVTPNIARVRFFAAGKAKKPSDCYNGVVASPLAAAVVTAICDAMFVHRPLNGPLYRGRFPAWRGARKQPINLIGPIPLLMGRFPTSLGHLPECLNGPFSLSKTLGKQPFLKKRGIKRLLVCATKIILLVSPLCVGDAWGLQTKSAAAQGQQLQPKRTSDATPLLPLCCRASVCHIGEGILDIRQDKRAQRLSFWVRRLPGGVGVFHAKGWGSKSCSLPRKFVVLGFRREELGMSREFCRDVPDPWGCSKC